MQAHTTNQSYHIINYFFQTNLLTKRSDNNTVGTSDYRFCYQLSTYNSISLKFDDYEQNITKYNMIYEALHIVANNLKKTIRR